MISKLIGNEIPGPGALWLSQDINWLNPVFVDDRIEVTLKVIHFSKIHKIITLTFTGRSIKFGNYTFLPKSIVQKLINEKATWSSFSGALSKIDKHISSISSIRGTRYFGPSKMSFFNLIKHSLSIIAVFKINVIIRSILFFLIYIFLISENLNYVTSIPLIAALALVISVLAISKRENIGELNDSLSNIKNIEKIK